MLTLSWFTAILVFIGIIVCPILTLAIILFATGHWVLGILALIVSFIRK